MTNDHCVSMPPVGSQERAKLVLDLLLDEIYPERRRRYKAIDPPAGQEATSYRRQRGLGPYRHTASIEPEALYNMLEDPQRFRADAEGDTVGEAANRAEKAVKDAGFAGYWVTDPYTGPVAAIFYALPVESVTYEPDEWA